MLHQKENKEIFILGFIHISWNNESPATISVILKRFTVINLTLFKLFWIQNIPLSTMHPPKQKFIQIGKDRRMPGLRCLAVFSHIQLFVTPGWSKIPWLIIREGCSVTSHFSFSLYCSEGFVPQDEWQVMLSLVKLGRDHHEQGILQQF